ncbi:MAG: GTP cyclohydrolase II, partial [Chryseobacterium sp.]
AIDILNNLGVEKINLLTNNPEKVRFVEESNIELNSRIPLQIPANENSRGYLQTKKDFFGHLLDDNNE